MRRALELARATSPRGPNPRVGCVLLTPDGDVLAEGWHRGAGTAYAEVDALAQAGGRARGATAVVTLEPCSHVGRTGPCTEALLAAGVARVVVGQQDPNPAAGGGAEVLRIAGVDVELGVLADECAAVNQRWAAAVQRGRPWVIWKAGATLDGRVSAADGSSQWITSEPSRLDAHVVRSGCDVILVGTGTALADRPRLTARDAAGELLADQPRRAVMGLRAMPDDHPLQAPDVLHLRTRDPHEALAALHQLEVRTMLLEGGPRVAAAFLGADLVDEVHWYLAPMVLGAGAPAVDDFGAVTLSGARSFRLVELARLGPDAKIRALAVGGGDAEARGLSGLQEKDQ